jgi:uncharacterized membrane protein HdeD (DUF308 family)
VADAVGTHAPDEGEELADQLWWVPLVTGSLWVLFALVVFRFDYTSVSALSILLGTVCLAAALVEAIGAAGSHGWWRAIHVGLAIVFAVLGVVAYVHPGDTFEALAAVFAFYLLVRGIYEIVVAVISHGTELWWVGLVTGTVQVLLAFWAAGDFGHEAFLLVVWVGASALARGIAEFVTAFRIRRRGLPSVRPA